MLPAKNRLNLSQAKNKRRQEGQKISGSDLYLVFKKIPNTRKAAVIVSKKVSKRAVDRNRIKRIIMEALKSQNIPEGELIVVVKKNIAAEKMQDVVEKLEPLFQKII